MQRAFLVVVGIATMLTISSCASPYDEATKEGLRQHVIAVSEASAAGDWQGAIAGLDVLADELSAARDAGKVDDSRFQSIVGAMELVRSDLEQAIANAEDEAERQRLLDEQARLQEQITQLQEQGNGEGDKKGEEDEKGGRRRRARRTRRGRRERTDVLAGDECAHSPSKPRRPTLRRGRFGLRRRRARRHHRGGIFAELIDLSPVGGAMHLQHRRFGRLRHRMVQTGPGHDRCDERSEASDLTSTHREPVRSEQVTHHGRIQRGRERPDDCLFDLQRGGLFGQMAEEDGLVFDLDAETGLHLVDTAVHASNVSHRRSPVHGLVNVGWPQ